MPLQDIKASQIQYIQMFITATSALGGIGASPWDRLSRLVFLQLFQSVEEFLARQDRNRNLPLNELKVCQELLMDGAGLVCNACLKFSVYQ